MQEVIERLVDNFAANPVAAGKVLRDLHEKDPNRFVTGVIPILGRLSGREHPGGDYLVTMLLASGFLPDALADAELFRLEEAIAVARAACRIDSRVAVRLAQRLGKANGGDGASDSRLLEIVEAVNPARTILPLLAHLSRHPDPRVRSKAALLIGRGNRNARWVETQLAQPDPRVRANAVEALWGVDTEEARGVLHEAAKDSHNRVAGNALRGLYRLGDPAVIPLILEMFQHESLAFRATAAWVMGESEDPRFLAGLTPAVLAGDGRVRQNAMRAMARIKQKIARAAEAPRLRVYLSRFKVFPDGTRHCRLAVTTENGTPLGQEAATEIVIWENSRLANEYWMEQPPRAENIAVAFGLPRSTSGDAWSDAAEQAVRVCLEQKRKTDLWGVVKYAPGADLKTSLEPVRLVSDPGLLKKAIAAPGLRDATPSGILDALDLMLQSMAPARGARSLILTASANSGTGALTMDGYHQHVEHIWREAAAARIAVHAVLPPEAPGMVEAALKKICPATGGLLLRAADAENLPELLTRLYLGGLDRYQLNWRRPPETAQEAVPAVVHPNVRVQLYSPHGYGEDSFPPAGEVDCGR